MILSNEVQDKYTFAATENGDFSGIGWFQGEGNTHENVRPQSQKMAVQSEPSYVPVNEFLPTAPASQPTQPAPSSGGGLLGGIATVLGAATPAVIAATTGQAPLDPTLISQQMQIEENRRRDRFYLTLLIVLFLLAAFFLFTKKSKA